MENSKKSRESQIIKTSIIGILANIFLASFKAVIGMISNSIAIVLDAVNNLSDALSSIITIIGTKLAGKAPDKEHPYGHGRAEYLSAMLISVIILYAGTTSLIESIKKIINPETPDYSIASLVILIVAIAVKIVLGIYVQKVGKKVNSESLIDSGKDALMDSIISTSTLIAAIIFIGFRISLEAWLGIIISVVIIKAGIDMIRSTISQIIGERIENEVSISIKKTVSSFDKVYGAYDLILNNYGPSTYLGSIHIEIEDTMKASEIDELTRNIMEKVYNEHGVILTAIGIYSINTQDEEIRQMREEISKIVHSYKSVLQMHGFYVNKKEKSISFDIIIDFNEDKKDEIYKKIYEKVGENYKDYDLKITMDFDASDWFFKLGTDFQIGDSPVLIWGLSRFKNGTDFGVISIFWCWQKSRLCIEW